MTTRIESIWAEELRQAKTHPIEPATFRLTRLDEEGLHDIYAGLDDGMNAILGLGLSRRPPAIPLESGAFDYFRRQRADNKWLLVLRLKRRGLESVFGRLCQDLADSAGLVETEHELVTLFVGRLGLWGRLFDGSDDGLLPGHRIRGLVGELVVLKHLLAGGESNLHETVEGWVGPTGADQDFRLGERSIEVKTVSPGSRSVTISSMQQLVSPVPLMLTIVSLGYAAVGMPSAVCLNSLVAHIENLVSSSPSALATLRERLLAAGYVDQPRYDEDWFVPLRDDNFSVTAGFPRICSSNVPAAIISASYELDISSLEEFRRPSPFA